MRIILLFLVLALRFIFGVGEVKAIIAPNLGCGWCGLGCTRLSSDMACIMIAPPEGKSCVEINGVCTITTQDSDPRPTVGGCISRPRCLDAVPPCMVTEPADGWCPSMPNPPAGCYYKTVQCFAAPCYPILVCPSGVPSVSPTCVPAPACFYGIRDVASGAMIYCDPQPGVTYCPRTTPTGTRPVALEGQTCGGIAGIICASGLRCDYGGYIFGSKMLADATGRCVRDTITPRFTPTPAPGCFYRQVQCVTAPCSPVLVCPSGTPPVRPTSTQCTPRLPCMDGIMGTNGQLVYCATDPLPGMAPYCPRLTPTCMPRPACLDANPACMFRLPEGGYFCPTTTGTGLPGDGNNDGKADLVDFAIWKRDYLQPSEGDMAGDFNKDGKTDLVDFSMWKAAYLENQVTPTFIYGCRNVEVQCAQAPCPTQVICVNSP